MLFFYFSEALKSFFRTRFSSLISIVTIFICTVLIFFSLTIVFLSDDIDRKIKDRIEISFFLEDSISAGRMNEIKEDILNIKGVKSVRYLSKQDAEKNFIKETGEDFRDILEFNPLPASFRIKLSQEFADNEKISAIVASLEKIEGADEIVYDAGYIIKSLDYLNSSAVFVYSAAIFFLLLSLYLIYSTNKLIINSKLRQYETMKLVGAPLTAIKIPVFINGIVSGIIAGTAGAFVIKFILGIIDKVYDIEFILKETYLVLAFVVLLSIALGFLGSFIATRNINLKSELFTN